MTTELETLYVVSHDTIERTVNETETLDVFDLGNGVTLRHGIREGGPVWIVENPQGEFGAVFFNVEV